MVIPNKSCAFIYERELDIITGWAKEYPNLETGGSLFGYWSHLGMPVVHFVLGPGPESRHNEGSFYQDRQYLERAGSPLNKEHALQHIGEWHSHHTLGLAQPSAGDARTMFNAIQQYGFTSFLLCIANLEQTGHRTRHRDDLQVSTGCFLYSRYAPRPALCEWHILPGESPVRSSLHRKRSNKFFTGLPRIPQRRRHQQSCRTTLNEVTVSTTRPVRVSREVWYTTPEGKELLRTMFNRLKSTFADLTMQRNGREEILFTFDANRKKVCLTFPNDFPQTAFACHIDGQAATVVNYNAEQYPISNINTFIQEIRSRTRNVPLSTPFIKTRPAGDAKPFIPAAARQVGFPSKVLNPTNRQPEHKEKAA